MAKRSSRNKTITLDPAEQKKYLARCAGLSDIKNGGFINKVLCGDMLAVSPFLPDNFVDLLIADPPYNLNKTFGNMSFYKTNDEKYREYTRSWLSAVKHTLKPDASVYVCCDWKCSHIIYEELARLFEVKNRITWQREKGRGAARNFKNGMEDIYFAVNGAGYTFNLDSVKQRRRVVAPYTENGDPKDWVKSEAGNFRDTHPSNFWDDISVPYWSMKENTSHPAQKPEKLIAKLILASSNPQDTVFDPFLGSGTTAVVAKKLNRRFLGIELSEEYCAVSARRLEAAETDNDIQGYTDGVFWERNTLAFQKKYKKNK